MPYVLVYHPDVRDRDIVRIDGKSRVALETAIRERLATEPGRFGASLRRDLKGHRKLRVGDYRVVYRIVHSEVLIFAIMHRRDVYARVGMRLGWKP
jgi:mRNA interferase RelE/StbE